ncbi:hypothetical protein HEQ45_09520 [Lactobacillus sp. ZJLC29-4]|nr:hypothetical protein [Lactobacillus sp. HBUAS51387]
MDKTQPEPECGHSGTNAVRSCDKVGIIENSDGLQENCGPFLFEKINDGRYWFGN